MRKRVRSTKPSRREVQSDCSAGRSWLEKKDLWLLFVVVVVSLLLNMPGFSWGLNGYVPWSPDAIEGITTVREMPKLFGKWTYKYPRLQFLIDGVCYKPFTSQWEKDPVYVTQNGQRRGQVYTAERLRKLAVISRINVHIMSTLILIFVYLIAKFYYADSIAAFFASLSLAVCYVFVYYSHTSCVDIPSAFWIVVGVFFLLRSVRFNKLWDHLFMAAAFACSCCTKDAMLFYAAAFVLVYIFLRLQMLRAEGLSFKAGLLNVFGWNVLFSLLTFLFIFALLQNIFLSPKAYWDRMGVWVGGRGVKDFNKNFKGQFNLLYQASRQFYWALGWPLIGLFVCSVIATAKRRFVFHAVVVLFPLVFFYVFVVMHIKMTFIRYYLPMICLAFLPVGAWMAEVFTWSKTRVARPVITVVGGGLVLSFAYCVALNIDLVNDTRNQTARWFEDHVAKDTVVLSLIKYPYGPQLRKHGYQMVDRWKVPPLEVFLKNQQAFPEYIMISYDWYTLSGDTAISLQKALFADQTDYEKAVRFVDESKIRLSRTPLAVAAWPVKSPLAKSLPVFVMRRTATSKK